MSYSIDFRKCVIDNISSGMSRDDAGRIFSVSKKIIYKWLNNLKSHGNLDDLPRKRYKTRKIDPEQLKAAIAANPDAILEELGEQFGCWPQSIHKRCVKLGITRKKNHAVRRAKRGKKTSI